MRKQFPFTATASGTISASGAATVSAGPTMPRVSWYPTSVSISCSGTQPVPAAPNVATCSVYVGSFVNPSGFVDATYQVLGASSSMIDGQKVTAGQFVFAVWANMTGSTGQTVTMIIQGTREIPRSVD